MNPPNAVDPHAPSDSNPATSTDEQPQPRRRGWFGRYRWPIRLALLAALFGYLSLVGCDGLFYHPSDNTWYHSADFGLTHEDVFFETDDGVRLHGWFVPATQRPSRGLVVHVHGNAANITNHIATVAWLPPHGYDVLLFDYRGYGQSQGRVTRDGTIRDTHAAIDYAISRPEHQPGRLFLYGQSLGGAVGCVVAAERKEIAAVVLDSTFHSYRGIAERHARGRFGPLGPWVARWLISVGHDPIDVVAEIAPRPLLVIAAEDDTICFPEFGRALFDAAGEPKQWYLAKGAEHYEAVQAAGRELELLITATFERGAALAAGDSRTAPSETMHAPPAP